MSISAETFSCVKTGWSATVYVMNEPKTPVWLFVIDIRTAPTLLAETVRDSSCRQAVVLTSHAPYPSEINAFKIALAHMPVHFVTMAELFDDSDLAALDAETTRELLAQHSAWEPYTERYERLVTRKKNTVALDFLRKKYAFSRFFCTAGPGIDTSFWAQQGARILSKPDVLGRLKRTLPAKAIRWLRNRLRRPPRVGSLIEDNGRRYLFLCSIRRLKLRPGTVVRKSLVRDTIFEADVIATTLHDHTDSVHRLGRLVCVFADGFLPSNYPRSFLDAYGPAEFVSNEPFALRWFKSCGMRVATAPEFIAQAHFSPAICRREIRTVIALLNHAGDWSALVHRSDTDVMVMALVELARAIPDLQFVLRIHPTIDHPRHEGLGARARIGAFVAGSSLPNLSISHETFDADLARGDFFLSEYSATLLDVWRAGLPGLAVNLTRRRSFMQDFVDLGFAEVSNINALEHTIREVRTNPVAFTTRQSVAAERYNTLVKKVYE